MKNGKIWRRAAISIFLMIIILSSATGVTVKNSQQNISPENIINDSKSFKMNSKEISEDTTDPIVKIEKPVKAGYIMNMKILPRFIRLTRIIGAITVEVNATDNESGINRVEFYCGLLGSKLLFNDTEAPYNYTWRRDRILPRIIHIHILKVVAYDNAGNSAADSIIVRKFL